MQIAFGRVRRKTAPTGPGYRNMHKKLLAEHYQDFRDALLMWFKEYQREMPWRNTDDPYQYLGLGGDAPADAGQEGCGLL